MLIATVINSKHAASFLEGKNMLGYGLIISVIFNGLFFYLIFL
jgi:hypothetical protein